MSALVSMPDPASVPSRRRDLVIRDRHDGDVECGTLTVERGATLVGNVRAERVLVRGTLRGVAKTFPGHPSEFSVARGGRFDGEVHMSSVTVAGRVSGIVHGKVVRLERAAEASGAVVADEFHAHPEARLRAMTFTGKGTAGPASRTLIDGLRGLVTMPVLAGRPEVASPLPAAAPPAPPTPAPAASVGAAPDDALADLDLEAFEREITSTYEPAVVALPARLPVEACVPDASPALSAHAAPQSSEARAPLLAVRGAVSAPAVEPVDPPRRPVAAPRRVIPFLIAD